MNKEVLEKVSKCKTVDEVLELAKSNGKTITKEQAKKAFDMTHSNGELSDEEVSNVSGGRAGCARNAYEVVYFDSKKDVKFLFKIGDKVEFYGIPYTNETFTAEIKKRNAVYDLLTDKWYDSYYVYYTSNGKTHCADGNRDSFEK